MELELTLHDAALLKDLQTLGIHIPAYVLSLRTRLLKFYLDPEHGNSQVFSRRMCEPQAVRSSLLLCSDFNECGVPLCVVSSSAVLLRE